jgi:putative membrane protein
MVAQAVATPAFFAQVSALHLLQIRAAELAMQRGNRQTRAVAQQAKKKHEGIATQLSLAGRRLNLLPSRVLPQSHEQLLRELRSSRDFDRAYASQHRALSRRAAELHSRYARSGASPTLRQVASFAATAVRPDF